MRKLCLIIIVLLALAGCRSEGSFATLTAEAPDDTPTAEVWTAEPITPTLLRSSPTPTQEPVSCRYNATLGDGFCVLNANPDLTGQPSQTEWDWRILQEYPPGYALYNLLETESGGTGEEFYVDWIGIERRNNGYGFDIAGRAARGGFESEQIIINQEQCVLVKATGHSSIQSIDHFGWNYSVGLIIEKQSGAVSVRGWRDLPVSGTYEAIWVQWLTPGAYGFTAFIQAAYATGLPGTDITLEAFAVGRDIDGDHCADLRTPKL